MANFVFTYRVPVNYTPARPDTMAEWGAWFQEMGERVVEQGKPVFESRVLGEVGEGARLGGYSIVDAEDFESALTLAKGCPLLTDGGGVEVGLLADMG
ncbi:MAG: hypothetical protein JWM85_3299 [Acidimicrobiaceae bacterium]|nr:hypothetical protein [Acidimicrobiaceae bacterium]